MGAYLKPFFHFLDDCYWCFIPLACRDCAFLEVCRYGFLKGRKCINGCVKIRKSKKWEKQKEYARLRDESFTALIEEANRREKELEEGRQQRD